MTVGGLRVDQAVTAAVLEALQPAGVQAAFTALDRVETAHDTQRQALALALEKARDEVQRARRHYDRVDPDHRLVAGELERRWHDALVHVAEVEAHRATLASRRSTLSDAQRHRWRTVGQDLTAVWDHPTAPEARKKRLLRTVLHAMLIETLHEPPEPMLQLHWHGGVHTELRVARHTAGKHGRATAQQALEVIGARSKVCRDQTSAATLKRLGDRTGTGKTWRTHRVACVR